MSLPAISPKKMQTPDKKPEQKMPEKPEKPGKNVGAKYMLPILVSAKLEGVARNLMPEFNEVPKLKLPEVKPYTEVSLAPRLVEETECEPVDELSYSEWYEQQVREFKEDMREENKWR
jgi:hypothetical protein